MKAWKPAALAGALLVCVVFRVGAAASVTQYGLVWTFKGNHQIGQYENGDYWVVGPVTVVSIENEFHPSGLKIDGVDGSMVNPSGGNKQGYDKRLKSYRVDLNAGLPGGNLISKTNPLILPINSSLISSVSWLEDEPGCPKINVSTKTPRPATRSMAILTCVDKTPPKGSFRPPYCGADKSPKFNMSQLNQSLLKNLKPVPATPDLERLEKAFAGPWVDHVNSWVGAMNHPDMHMPNYGREMNILIGEAMLMLQLDFSQLPGSPAKDKLLMEMVQLGIDLAGIADVGGGWPCDGGHSAGRKWPILFAGVMLGDGHMQSVGQWDTDFQEDQDTFYVSQAEVDITHSSVWAPDTRAAELWPYEAENIGLPEWGIRHETEPHRDNLHWSATYRDNNNQQYPGWVLAVHIMDQRAAWNHDALFDYTDRAVTLGHYKYKPGDKEYVWYAFGSSFIKEMWQTYRAGFGPVWTPDNPSGGH